eukprot:7390053-Prymnesium_polylepis.1
MCLSSDQVRCHVVPWGQNGTMAANPTGPASGLSSPDVTPSGDFRGGFGAMAQRVVRITAQHAGGAALRLPS